MKSRDDNLTTPDSDGDVVVHGPHLWLNWRAAMSGQTARESWETPGIQYIPVWNEYGLYSDSSIVGQHEAGPYSISTSLSGMPRLGQAQLAAIARDRDHLRYSEPRAEPEPPEDDDVAAYTGGDLPDQLAALLSLALGCRMRSGGVLRQGTAADETSARWTLVDHRAPVLIPPRHAPMLPAIAGERSLAESEGLLDRFARAPAASAAALLRAATHYADAVWWADAEPRLSWLKLCSALEAAAFHLAAIDDPMEALERVRPDLHRELKKAGCDLCLEIVARRLSKTMGVGAKLRRLVEDHAASAPTTSARREPFDFDDEALDGIPDAIALIYEHRSRELHEGVPIPDPLCQPPWPIDGSLLKRPPGLAYSSQGGSWPAHRLPMNLQFFESVSRRILLTWWERLPQDSPPNGSRPASG